MANWRDRSARYPAQATPGRRRPLGGPEGYFDMVASLGDAAEDAARSLTGQRSWRRDSGARGGSSRPYDAVTERILDLNDALVEVGEGIIDFLDVRKWSGGSAHPVANPFRARRRESPHKLYENELVDEARHYISRGDRRGATLDGLIRYLEPASDLSRGDLERLIERHFVVDGDLVFLSDDHTLAAAAGLPDSTEAHLRALGYDDLRRNVRLERLDDDSPSARLVGYVNDNPVVLVFVAPLGRVDDPFVEEDARFQAKALSRDATPQIVYITDGATNRYLSLEDDRVLSEIPPASHAAGSPADRGGATRRPEG